jgi:hypothetical protein
MPFADKRLKPMQGLHGFTPQTLINADKTHLNMFVLPPFTLGYRKASASKAIRYLRANGY